MESIHNEFGDFSLKSTSFYSEGKSNITEEKEKEKEKAKTEGLKYKNIVCSKCSLFPLIDFKNNNKINITCKCGTKENLNIKSFIEDYMKENIAIECKEHNEIYTSYCEDCKKDICSKCLATTQHQNQTINNFLIDESKITAIENTINEYEKKNDEEKSKYPEDKYVIEIFRVMIKYFDDDNIKLDNSVDISCKNHLESINNAYNFLDNFIHHRNEEYNDLNNANNLMQEVKEKFTNRIELDQINQKPELIVQLVDINISEQNLNNLKIFEGKHFRNLKKLYLEENNIYTIDSLMKADTCDLLEELSLARNKIDDKELFKHIEQFNSKFPKLQFFNIYGNYLTDYKIFIKLGELKELKKLYIGSNKFEKNKIEEDIFFPKLEEFGGSNGVFNKTTIQYLSHFKFENLIEIYLQGNSLDSLDFLQYLNCKNLKVLWLYKNYIHEYNIILKYSFYELEDINLKYNKIKNIDDIKDFVAELKYLKYLYLSNNPFNFYCSDKRAIEEEIKKINDKLLLDL